MPRGSGSSAHHPSLRAPSRSGSSAHHPSDRRVPSNHGAEDLSPGCTDGPPAWPQQGGTVSGWGLATHPPQAGTAALTCPRWRPGCTCRSERTSRRTRGGCRHLHGAQTWLPGGPDCRGAPPPPPSEATATRAHAATTHHSCSVRAAPPCDPRAGELQEQRPCGHSASGGRAFSRPRAASTQGTEKASGWPSHTGLAQPSCPEDTAGPLNRGGHSPEGFAGTAQVLPGNHLAMPCPHPRS